MNDIAKKRIADTVLLAIEKEGITQRQAAKFLGTSQCYITLLKKPDDYDKIPGDTWEVLRKFVNSGNRITNKYSYERKSENQYPHLPDQAMDDKDMMVQVKPDMDEIKEWKENPEIEKVSHDPPVNVKVHPNDFLPSEIEKKILLDLEIEVHVNVKPVTT